MKPSKLDSKQIFKVLKAGLYIAISAFLGSIIVVTTDSPEFFGPYTVVINMALVFLKQLFTPTGK